MALVVTLLAIFGLIFGSFLTVIIYRLPLSQSISYPPSHCENCNKRIKWYDNIPLISYIILGGKCRYCKSKISPIYPIIELLNALIWIATYLIFNLTVYSILYMLTFSILIAISAIDYKHQIIPDSLNLAIGIFGIIATVYSIFNPFVNNVFLDNYVFWWERLIGSVGGGILFLLLYYAYKKLRKCEALGGGDIKFIFAIGLLLGYELTLLTIGFSAIFACIYLIIKAILRKDVTTPFAFGPFLCLGAINALFFGSYLIYLYISLF